MRAKFGYIAIRHAEGPESRGQIGMGVFRRFARRGDPRTSLDHQHDDVRKAIKLPADFVIHSLRHTMLTRLGEAGADAFTIMRIAGHSSVTVSQRYVHPTPEGRERAFERLEDLNSQKFDEAEAEAKAEAAGGYLVPAKVPTAKTPRLRNSSQVIEIKRTGP